MCKLATLPTGPNLHPYVKRVNFTLIPDNYSVDRVNNKGLFIVGNNSGDARYCLF